MDEENQELAESEDELGKEVLKTGAKGIAIAYAGKAGGKAVDAISNTKIGNKVLENTANHINKNNRFGKKPTRVNSNETSNTANNGINAIGGSIGTSPSTIDTSSTITSGVSTNKLIKNPITKKIILITIPIAIGLLFVIFLIAAIFGANYAGNNMAVGGYYSSKCPEITVIFTDKSKDYEITGTNTYDLEEYVAGVIKGEVGFLGSLELDKAFAIAARSYVLTHENDCTIESSDRKQVFRELTNSGTDQLAIQAANETKGKVLLLDNQLTSSQYDAFACIAKDDNYYTISQANQKLPKEWVESRINPQNVPQWFICNGKENLQNHHGNGMSQYGGLYLATEQGYTYTEILNYYLGDLGITISSNSFTSNIAGLEIKDTTNATELHQSLNTYLSSNGTSIDDLNTFIHSSVEENGVGTRAGVVTAAVSLVNYLYDNMNIRIPYYWGGNYQRVGVNPEFGAIINPSISKGGNAYYYSGFDCSGFVSWAIRNGGYSMSRKTTSSFDSTFGSDSCNIGDSSCIGQPGDLINSASCHVQLIVSVDESSEKYYVAESTGNYGLIMRPWDMHSGNCGGAETKIIHMDNFYNNNANIDKNY